MCEGPQVKRLVGWDWEQNMLQKGEAGQLLVSVKNNQGCPALAKPYFGTPIKVIMAYAREQTTASATDM